MEEVTTCQCGCQERWTIFMGRVRCNGCGKEYEFMKSESKVVMKADDIVWWVNGKTVMGN